MEDISIKSTHFYKPKNTRNIIKVNKSISNRYKILNNQSTESTKEYDNSLLKSQKKFFSKIGKNIIKPYNFHSVKKIKKTKKFISRNYISNSYKNIIYDPYLIKACKTAIINNKKQLPNYKEIINKINKEFNIKEENEKTNDDNNNINELNDNNNKINKNDLSIAETNYNINENNNK
jgi:hypothetical protein